MFSRLRETKPPVVQVAYCRLAVVSVAPNSRPNRTPEAYSPRKSASGPLFPIISRMLRRSSSGVGRPTKYQPLKIRWIVRSGSSAKVKGTGSGPCTLSVVSRMPSSSVSCSCASLRKGNCAPSPALKAAWTLGGSTETTAKRQYATSVDRWNWTSSDS